MNSFDNLQRTRLMRRNCPVPPFVELACCVVGVLTALTLGGCDLKPETHELSRTRSPTQQIDAVVGEMLTDATVSTPYVVTLASRDAPVEWGAEVFRSDRGGPPSVRWVGPVLQITAGEGARIWHFQNFGVLRMGEQFIQIKIELLENSPAP